MSANPSSPSTSASLIGQAKRSDSQAWSRLVSIYDPLIVCWCGYASVQPADAADIRQDVFQAVAANIASFERVRTGSFRSWLKAIFRSKLIDFLRERGRFPTVVGGEDLDHFAAEVDAKIDSEDNLNRENTELLQRTMTVIRGDFNESTWEAFWMSLVEKERTSVIAKKLQMTPAAVCSARTRVLRRLRETISGMDILPDFD